MSINAIQIANYLGVKLYGRNFKIIKPHSLDSIEQSSLVFADHYKDEIKEKFNMFANVLAIVLPEYKDKISCSYIISENPKYDFVRAMQEFFIIRKSISRIAKTAILGQNIKLGDDVSIGEYSVIGNNVSIGDHTEIRNHVIIGDNTVVGSDCVLKSHCVIGEEGFGPVVDPDGHPILFPHIGNVIIGNHVQIGSFTSVNKSALDSTIIKDFVKIDDHTFIAHNVIVEENCIITCAKVGGSTIIGKNVWIGSNATIINKTKISDDSLIGIGSVVIRDVEKNKIVAGNPAKVLKDRF